MSNRDKWAGDTDDAMVAGALKHFKASVDAWSDAAYSRQRTPVTAARRTWRLAASWALGCLLAAGSLAGSLYERHVRQESARVAAMKAAQQKTATERNATEQPVAATTDATHPHIAVTKPASEDEDLLATVDSDVSRQVPSAMEPLAQMMESNNGAN